MVSEEVLHGTLAEVGWTKGAWLRGNVGWVGQLISIVATWSGELALHVKNHKGTLGLVVNMMDESSNVLVLGQHILREVIIVITPLGPWRILLGNEFLVIAVGAWWEVATLIFNLVASSKINLYCDTVFLLHFFSVKSCKASTQLSELLCHLNKGLASHEWVGLDIFRDFLDPARSVLIVGRIVSSIHGAL